LQPYVIESCGFQPNVQKEILTLWCTVAKLWWHKLCAVFLDHSV